MAADAATAAASAASAASSAPMAAAGAHRGGPHRTEAAAHRRPVPRGKPATGGEETGVSAHAPHHVMAVSLGRV